MFNFCQTVNITHEYYIYPVATKEEQEANFSKCLSHRETADNPSGTTFEGLAQNYRQRVSSKSLSVKNQGIQLTSQDVSLANSRCKPKIHKLNQSENQKSSLEIYEHNNSFATAQDYQFSRKIRSEESCSLPYEDDRFQLSRASLSSFSSTCQNLSSPQPGILEVGPLSHNLAVNPIYLAPKVSFHRSRRCNLQDAISSVSKRTEDSLIHSRELKVEESLIVKRPSLAFREINQKFHSINWSIYLAQGAVAPHMLFSIKEHLLSNKNQDYLNQLKIYAMIAAHSQETCVPWPQNLLELYTSFNFNKKLLLAKEPFTDTLWNGLRQKRVSSSKVVQEFANLKECLKWAAERVGIFPASNLEVQDFVLVHDVIKLHNFSKLEQNQDKAIAKQQQIYQLVEKTIEIVQQKLQAYARFF